MKRRAAVVAVTTVAMTVGSSAAWAVVGQYSSTTQSVTDTSLWTPTSPDPSGITYDSDADRIIVSDAEVDEIPAPQPGAYQGKNIYTMTRSGTLTGTGTTQEPLGSTAWSVEPTGLAYNAGTLYVSDDDKKSVFTITGKGGDGVFGTGDDTPAIPTGFKTSTFGNTDPEGVAYDSKRNELLLINGQTGARFYRLTKGANLKFDGVAPGGDDIVTEIDLTRYNVIDPEGIAYDAVRDTILVSSDGSQKIFELDINGALLNTINIAGMNAQNAADLVIAPSSSGSGRSYYLVDRGLDNNSHPGENDGKVFEVKADLPPITNRPPVADAGVDQMLDLGETLTLAGGGKDSDNDALTYQWTKFSGPGTVTMATPNAATTTATFSTTGDYVMRLTVRDPSGEIATDDATIKVLAPGSNRNVALPILSGADDALEGGGSTGKFVDLASADNELGNNGGTNPFPILTGLRFGNIPVPPGSEIVNAYIQFKVDEGSTGSAAFTVVGEAADNAAGYVAASGNISARAKTSASVAWSPPTWSSPAPPDGGAAGPEQATPNLKPILQEIVSRPGWQKGNAAAFMISGSGRRTAEAKDGLSPPVLMLEFRTPGPVANTAPVVNAGPDQTITMPSAASLDGTVTDDGLPGAVTTTWSKVSGPGSVSFGNAGQQDTTATFGKAGTFVLQLTANDGALATSDQVTVTVQGSASGPGSAQPSLTATASDATVPVGSPTAINGTLSPALDGQTVVLQRLSGTTWSDVSSAAAVGGASANVSFTVTSSTTGSVQYRLVAPATGNSLQAVSNSVTVKYQKVKVAEVRYASDVVVLKNLGTVRVNLKGWTVKNKKNGKQVVLPSFVLKRGAVVYVHTGKGSNTRKHLYLAKRDMWGKHGKAVLRDDGGSAAGSLRY